MATKIIGGTLGPRYQFQIDGRGFGAPVRDNWADAAQDAVSAGYGVWTGTGGVKLDEQADIAQLPG